MNAIDFIRESASYLVDERPDVYDQETAVEEISTAIDALREDNEEFGCVMFTSFLLVRIVHDEEDEEFLLTRKVSGMLYCEGEGVTAYSFDPVAVEGLPYILDVAGLDEDLDEDDEV